MKKKYFPALAFFLCISSSDERRAPGMGSVVVIYHYLFIHLFAKIERIIVSVFPLAF